METFASIAAALSEFAPDMLSEEYDNTGLLVGNPSQLVSKILLAYEITEEVVKEALYEGCQLIITHHPLIFKSLKKLTEQSPEEKLIASLIRHNIGHIALHTNADNILTGVNKALANRLGIENFKILKPGKDKLYSLVVFIPDEAFERVEAAVFEAGAGRIGNYSHCGYALSGTGSFIPLENANPAIGRIHQLERVSERRLEVIVPGRRLRTVLSAMLQAHPYEEVAHFIHPLQNTDPESGSGGIGNLPKPMNYLEFVQMVKNVLKADVIRASKLHPDTVQRVAFCGGAGAFLIPYAKEQGAEVFISGDIKYHDFFRADPSFGILDAGHCETEWMILNEIADFLNKKFHTFAIQISNVQTNPVKIL